MEKINNEDGKWITYQGRHLFIKDGETPAQVFTRHSKEVAASESDRQEKEIAESKKRTEDYNDPVSDNPEIAKKLRDALNMKESTFEELSDKITALYEAIGSTTGIDQKKSKLIQDALKAHHRLEEVYKMGYMNTEGKESKALKEYNAKKAGGDKPEGKPIETPQWFTDNRKGIAYGYQKYKNGYFVEEYDQKTEKSTIRRISKEEFEKGRGADHAKMKASDFTSQIAEVRSMPEKTLTDIKKKNEAYISLINTMKKSGYQGSEDKDYQDVISEFSGLAVREGGLKRGRDAQKKQVATIKKNLENTMSGNKGFSNLRNFKAVRRGDNVVVTYDYDVVKDGKHLKAHVRTVIDKDGKITKSMTE